MPAAPPPLNEEARLAALRRCDVLDTSPEPAFDAITRLAARIFRTPIALVALVDQQRQWFKSQVGFGACQTDRDAAFCSYTILTPEPLVVPDATLDARFADSTLVTGPPFLRFYAGAPIADAAGLRLGTVCVLDTQPRQIEAEQVEILRELAALAARELEARTARTPHGQDQPGPNPTHGAAALARSSAALREAETLYRRIFENAVEGIFESTPEGTLLSGNPALARLMGYNSPQEMLEEIDNLASVYVEPGRRAELAQQMRETGMIVNAESQKRRRDGAVIWASENIRAVRDAAGQVVRYEGTVEDITARKEAEAALARERETLEERVRERTAELAQANEKLRHEISQREHAEETAQRSESKFRALLENAQDLLTITDTEGTILYSSPSIQHMLGYGTDELLGLNAFAYMHPEDQPQVREAIRRVLEEGASYERREHRFRHKDGSWRQLESIGSQSPADSPIAGLVINSRDITERRQAERERETHTRQQEAMAELGRRALRTTDPAEMFTAAASLVRHALQTELSTVCELLPGGETMLVRACDGWPCDDAGEKIVANWRGSVAGMDVLNPEPLIIPDLQGVPGCKVVFPDIMAKPPTSAVSVLIQAGGQPFGSLCVLSVEPREFSRQEITFLQTAADLLSTIIDRHRHEEALRAVEARYQRIAANTPGVVYQFALRPDGSVYFPFISEGCREMYGVEPAEVYKDPYLIHGAVHPEDEAVFRETIITSAALLQPWHWEGRLRLASGKVKWIRGDSRPERQPSGDILWDGVLADITQQRTADIVLRSAKEEAERANAAKSEFLSRMSHELRTPLNAILGFGQLLQLEDLGARHNQSVEHILTGGRHLLDLVNEVLDMTQIEAGQAELETEPVEVQAALDQAVEMLQPMARQHRVRFETLTPLCRQRIMADAARLHQVLLNLIANAIKFNAEGGVVRFFCQRADNARMRVSITDEGPGIAEKDRARLFTPFERLNASQRGIEGVGMGLAITRRLVEAMHGVIGVRSRLNHGSTFYIELPEASESTNQHASSPVAAPAILLIGGDSAEAALMRGWLQEPSSRQMSEAPDGRSGLSIARETRPGLILLELHLPDMDGAEALGRLRAHSSTRAIPVIILSDEHDPMRAQQLRRMGAHAFLTKPLDETAFRQAAGSAPGFAAS